MNKFLLIAFATLPLVASAQHTITTATTSSLSTNKSATASQDELYHVGHGVTPPELTHQVAPKFSEEAREEEFSGVVDVYLMVDEHGKPQNVRVAKSAGHGLDEEAVKAVKKYRFKPAMKDGKPVKVDLFVNVSFQIERRR